MLINYVESFKKLALDVNLDPVSTNYCLRRIHSEGIQFLTETLPRLSKAVLRSLELGYFDRPTEFRWKGKALLYFKELLSGIFCFTSGQVLEKVDPQSVKRLRQLCDYFYKLSLPFNDRDLEKAESNFIDDEADLAKNYDRLWVEKLRKDFETYYSQLSRAEIHDVYKHSLPRPGPGTFSGKSSWGKWWFLRKERPLTIRKEDLPHVGYFRSYQNAPLPKLERRDPDFSEVLFVPKDSRGPRVIVREPFTHLLGQMSFNSFLSSHLEKATDRRVNFQSQQVNRELAETSSLDRGWATIDLKSASDRVSHRIMGSIFRNSPAMRFFYLSRTKRALLPVSKRVISLNKLAGMGSGLTFPSMSLLITLTVTRSFVDYLRIPYAQARKLVYVYGDDIIVPTNLYDYAVESLRRVFLRVNEEKSYRFSHFRESCGGDFYNGVNVTPVRLRLPGQERTINRRRECITTPIDDHSAILQLERHCRELVVAGLTELAEYYYQTLSRSLGPLPTVSGCTPVLGRYSVEPGVYGCDETGTYHKVSCYVPVSVKSERFPDPHVFLGRFLRLKNATHIDEDFQVIEGPTYHEVTIPRRVVLRRRRLSAFRLMG